MVNKLFLFAVEKIDPCTEGYLGSDKCIEGGNESDITSLIHNITNWLTIAVGIVAVVFIIISAIQMITSSGEAEKVKKAQRTLIYSVIGLVVAILANVIIGLVFNIADNFYA